MTDHRYVFIELLRQVCPVDNRYEDFSYFLLGTFDAMYIETGESIQDLKRIYEVRQERIPPVFDRQPLFLYSSADMSRGSDSIFDRTNEYESLPLVITLFQMDKIAMSRNSGLDQPDQLLSAFSAMLKQTHGFDETIRYQVFWNLGESDIAVVFRPDSLRKLANTLHSFRTGTYIHDESLIVISTSSHCAFPKPVNIHGDISADNQKTALREPLEKWINREYNDDTSFITLGNASSYDPVNGDVSFLFGEWDYIRTFRQDKKEDLLSYLINTFCRLLDETYKPEGTAPFNISYTIPMISVDNKDPGSPSSHRVEWSDLLSPAMNDLRNAITASTLTQERKNDLTNSISSFRNTILGMMKYLYRLCKGRYEEDLYAYVQPVFNRLANITCDYQKNFIYLCSVGAESDADMLICEYIDDTSRLIGRLQHLFAVMAVSPHTYLETYGSSMRSLAAADKLLDAYQGIISFLKNNFPDQIRGEPSEREILIFPYRKAQSRHTLLYRHSDPMNRVSYILLDFTKMFSLKASIFMLLHECGHHLGSRLRKERFMCLTKASVSMALEWFLEDYISNPLPTFITRVYSPQITEAAKKAHVRVLFAGLDKSKQVELAEKYTDRIRSFTVNILRQAGNAASITHYVDYLSTIDTKYLDDDLYNEYFSEPVLVYLSERFLPEYFGCLISGEMNEEAIESNRKFRYELEKNVSKTVGTKLCETADDLVKEVSSLGGNVREALRIKTVYSHSDEFAKDVLQHADFILKSKLRSGSLDELYGIFANIYSDIFAIRILNIGWREYIRIIPENLGVNRTAIPVHEANLLRVYAVLTALWPDADIRQAAAMLDTAGDSSVADMWENFECKACLPFMKEYACKCMKEMETLIAEKSVCDRKSFEMLSSLFRSDDPAVLINGIYHFYNYLMRYSGGE